MAWIIASGSLRAETQILVTIKPLHSLVAQVMGATGQPELLVTGSASPHSYVLKPSDARKLAAADILFRISDTVEPFMIKARELVQPAALVVAMDSAPGIKSLPQRSGGPFEAHHHHDDAGSPDDDHDAEHDAEHEHAHAGDPTHTQVDGHIWLDPSNAAAMLDEIAKTLSSRTPALTTTYLANAASAKARIEAMSARLSAQMAHLAARPYLVFHDAYQYFEIRFGLHVAGSITVNPDSPPSGKRLSDLRATVAKLGATCVFGEPNFDAKVIATVIEGSKAQSAILDPEGAALPPGPALYETLMQNLANDISACLDRG